MTSHIGFPHQRVQNPDVRVNIAIYSNSELRYDKGRVIPNQDFSNVFVMVKILS